MYVFVEFVRCLTQRGKCLKLFLLHAVHTKIEPERRKTVSQQKKVNDKKQEIKFSVNLGKKIDRLMIKRESANVKYKTADILQV